MKNISLVSLFLGFILLLGCSGKKYFEPEITYDAPSISYSETIVDLSRDGATLDNGTYIGKSGISRVDLGEGYRFLSENKKFILASNTEGILNIIDKKTQESARAISLHVPVVSATIYKGLIAYILNNNTFGLYNIADNKKLIENRSEKTFAIDTRASSPIFIDNLAVLPMLDGKLIIMDSSNTDNAKVVYLSSDRVFNNILFLSRMGDTLVAATPKKVITIGTHGKLEYSENISEIAINEKNIYLFTKEGNIIKINDKLEKIASAEFKFAHFSVATILESKVYALDQQGSLIVISSDLKKHKIYDLGEVETPAFIAGSKLYKDGDVINLSKLGYE